MRPINVLLAGLYLIGAALPTASGAAEVRARAVIIPETKAVFGQVQSRTVVPARARIGGTVREIRISEGSEVKEGQVVAVIVDDKIALELAAAQAKIDALKSQLKNARIELERAQQLLQRGVTAQSRFDQAKTQFDVIVNQMAAAEADKSVIEQRAREGEVLAPATGRVLTVPVTEGTVLLPGEEIARIATGPYYLRLSLPERHAAEIVEGATVTIGQRGLSPTKSGSVETAREGRIAKVYPEIASGRVIADVEVSGIGDYFVNERTLVWIPVGKRKVIAVPTAAVRTRQGIDYIRIAAAQGEQDVPVILGETFSDSEEEPLVEVMTGLRDGDRVILP